MVVLLQYYGIEPLIVFDGASLPQKGAEETARRARRSNAREKVKELLAAGRSREDREVVNQAIQGISVTSGMIARVMDALREYGVHFLVAPFEADAQLAYLCKKDFVYAVVTEDSDLVCYGSP